MATDKHTELVTVLMPCYNAMPFLIDALESIIHQTYTNLEILCINDGSTDETGEVLERYTEEDKRIRVVHNETNLKLIKTLNKGTLLAKGKYIARMDADDISELSRIEIQMKYLLEHPMVDLISTGMTVISEEGEFVGSEVPRQFCSKSSLFASFFYVPFHHAPMIIKTNVLKENLFLDESHALHTEDFEFFARLLVLDYRCENIADKLYRVRLNSQSVSRKFTKLQDKNFVESAKRHYYTYSGVEYSTKIVNVLVNRIGKKTLTVENLKMGLIEMKTFKKVFIKKEGVRDPIVLREIEAIYNTHLFDILFQAFKRSKGRVRIFVFFQFLKNCRLFLNRDVRSYLKTKTLRH